MVPQELSVLDDSNLSRNEKFLRKMKEIVELNLHNEQFGVEELAREIAINRAHLYRKINKLTGKTISQFIREVRLERAKELLIQDVASIAEIAYQVGFSSPTYFNKCFHDTYGFPPGEISKLKQKEELGLTNPGKKSQLPKNKKNQYSILDIYLSRKPLRLFVSLITLVFISVTATIYFVKDRSSIASSTVKTIAVLPFRNDSPDSENEYFCRGMVEEMITYLQKIKDIRVKSRSSINNYNIEGKNLKRIGRELNVSYILEGSVMKAGDELRINVQLVNGKTGEYLWAETYDGSYSEELFKFQQNTALQIAEALHAIITPEEKKKIVTQPTVDVSAYDYILRAREEQWMYWNTRDKIALKNAEMLYDKALKLDPDYALGWARKGSIYFDMHVDTEEYYKEDYLDSVFWFCDKSSHLDLTLTSFNLRAMVYHKKNDIKNAIHAYDQAIKFSLNKNNDDWGVWEAMWRLDFIYIYDKKYQKGITLLRDAVKFSKVSPRDYGHMLYRLGFAYIWIGAYEEAEKYYFQSREMGARFIPIYYAYFYQGNLKAALDCSVPCKDDQPEFWCFNLLGNTYVQPRDYETDIWGWYLLGNIYFQLRDYENAIKYYQQFRKSMEARRLIQLDNIYREGIALVELGKQAEGMALIEKQLVLLNQRKKLGRADGYDYHLAAIYSYFGEYDKALQHLKDYNQKIFFPDFNIIPLNFIQYDILFDAIRNNPEFQALLKQDQDEKTVARALIRQMEETAIE